MPKSVQFNSVGIGKTVATFPTSPPWLMDSVGKLASPAGLSDPDGSVPACERLEGEHKAIRKLPGQTFRLLLDTGSQQFILRLGAVRRPQV